MEKQLTAEERSDYYRELWERANREKVDAEHTLAQVRGELVEAKQYFYGGMGEELFAGDTLLKRIQALFDWYEGMMDKFGTERDTARDSRRRLVRLVREMQESFGDILYTLGTGECGINTCEGCKYETSEAIRIAERFSNVNKLISGLTQTHGTVEIL
jgi:hypothetical protein